MNAKISEEDASAGIADAIRNAGGQITFERFMELALYQPGSGYYSKNPAIGRHGDFFTNVSVGALFGRILASKLCQFRQELGNPTDFKVIEFGGHQGQLRDDVLRNAPDLDYQIVEHGDRMPDQLTGCILSNEFLDALPVHRVKVIHGKWQELYVALANGDERRFAEIAGPLSTTRLETALAPLPAHLMEGYTTEINLRALDWMQDVARRLTRGYMVTFDYGHERSHYFAPHRREGTLLCYHRHNLNHDPYARIGEQDITAHVEFRSLMELGGQLGLETILFCDQSQFILGAGVEILQEIVTRDAGRWSSERNQIHQLMHPGLMGQAFKVLIQRKNGHNEN